MIYKLLLNNTISMIFISLSSIYQFGAKRVADKT